MAYSTSNPPRLGSHGIGGSTAGGNMWFYESTDTAATIDTSGYITNAKSLGMKVGDRLYALKTDASPISQTLHHVVSINSTTGAADLADAGATISTNTD